MSKITKVLILLTLTFLPMITKASNWDQFKEHYLHLKKIDFAIDTSRMDIPESFYSEMEPNMQKAFKAMESLEKGAIANPDENRMVGHYWLRNPSLAPSAEIAQEIEENINNIRDFAAKVHRGEIKGEKGNFENLLVIGIGGSALGPQFVSKVLGGPKSNKLNPYFFDNTDPDSMDATFHRLEGKLGQTLVVVISKSGSTPETRNGMVEAEAAYKKAGLNFGKHAVAITGKDSKLDNHAKENGWINRFPLWDWVGGRTSELASVGLLPAALQGIDIEEMLNGAKEMDEATRSQNTKENPAARLALAWYYATGGKGKKDMVILPYKDRLSLFSKYLQQLVMESLGKEKDLDGNIVNQGISVYGNKGSTDQHAYVQQLRDGINNFFVTFIEVSKDRNEPEVEIEPNTTSGDYLQAFLLGTRDALHAKNRGSITLTVKEVDPKTVGKLIALYERAVGFYASLVNINAYHQPGVEAGKKAAAQTLELKRKITEHLKNNPKTYFTPEEIAEAINEPEHAELGFKILEHLAANNRALKEEGKHFYDAAYANKP